MLRGSWRGVAGRGGAGRGGAHRGAAGRGQVEVDRCRCLQLSVCFGSWRRCSRAPTSGTRTRTCACARSSSATRLSCCEPSRRAPLRPETSAFGSANSVPIQPGRVRPGSEWHGQRHGRGPPAHSVLRMCELTGSPTRCAYSQVRCAAHTRDPRTADQSGHSRVHPRRWSSAAPAPAPHARTSAALFLLHWPFACHFPSATLCSDALARTRTPHPSLAAAATSAAAFAMVG